MVQTYAENEDDTWAIEAVKRWDADLELLEAFYEEEEEKPESYLVEKQALKEQYEPNIHVSVVNGGMFYLQQQVLLKKNELQSNVVRLSFDLVSYWSSGTSCNDRNDCRNRKPAKHNK